jgi:DNA-binding transcriptional MerR regulator
MKIGETAKHTGLKIETVRYYEAEGLVPQPIRSVSNYRLYDRSHLDHLSFHPEVTRSEFHA